MVLCCLWQGLELHRGDGGEGGRQSSGGGLRKGLERRLNRRGGDVYCVLAAEGRVKRTALAMGGPAPAWRQELSFKAVQISSDLQARRYTGCHHGLPVLMCAVLRSATPAWLRPALRQLCTGCLFCLVAGGTDLPLHSLLIR